jgi:hypothetical protein
MKQSAPHARARPQRRYWPRLRLDRIEQLARRFLADEQHVERTHDCAEAPCAEPQQQFVGRFAVGEHDARALLDAALRELPRDGVDRLCELLETHAHLPVDIDDRGLVRRVPPVLFEQSGNGAPGRIGYGMTGARHELSRAPARTVP